MSHFCSIPEAIKEIRNGRMIILVDDENREKEGDLVVAAEKITPEIINFMIKHARGIVCLTVTEALVNRLQIPLMAERSKNQNQALFTTSIEAAHGVSSGVSVHDRAYTIQAAIDPLSCPADINMPGHVFPIQARPNGVLERPGHTEGSVDLAKLAGLQPSAVICEVIKDDGSMARLPELIEFAKLHGIKMAAINDLITYRMEHETKSSTFA